MTVLFPQIASPTPLPASAAVVAIPARNEAARIGACLDALAAQRDAAALTVLLLLNDCTDATEAVARAHAARAPFRLVLRHAVLPAGRVHAGEARGRAMDAGAALLEREARPDGLLLTTDADSRVAPDWLAAIQAELRAGADAVAGQVDYDPAETARLPIALRQRMAQEDSYAMLLAELEARLDPVRGDGWPRHRMASGASLAVRLPAYRRAGGLPRLPVGEDRALLAALRAVDARIRHAPGVRVLTSCRTEGRAIGGAADTLRLRAGQPGLPCDSLLEPVGTAAMRWRARAALRRLHAAGDEAGAARWAAGLLLRPNFLRQIKDSPFGTLWQMAEATSPLLRPVPLLPAALPAEIAAARRLLTGLRPAAAGPAGSGPCGSAPPEPVPAPSPP
jgi:hypothetical protein